MKTINPPIQESQQILSTGNMNKTTPGHNKVKLFKSSGNLKSSQSKKTCFILRNKGSRFLIGNNANEKIGEHCL